MSGVYTPPQCLIRRPSQQMKIQDKGVNGSISEVKSGSRGCTIAQVTKINRDHCCSGKIQFQGWKGSARYHQTTNLGLYDGKTNFRLHSVIAIPLSSTPSCRG